MAWVIRRQFADTGKQLAASLRPRRRPTCPRSSTSDTTTIATRGGSKDEIGDYFRMIAAAGFTMVAVEYALAPGARYPTPVRKVMAAIDGLPELDPDTLGDGELTQTVIALHRQQARLAAAVTR
jgi:hypothetical protein